MSTPYQEKIEKIKYETPEDVQRHREELAKEYDGGLPEYLHNYFDDILLRVKKNQFFLEKKKMKYSATLEEKKEYMEKKKEDFWKGNDFVIIKKQKRTGNPVFEEAPRNSQRIEDEQDLTEEEIKILIAMCETDLYLFAIRYFSHYLKKPSSEFHKYLYSYLTENTNNRKKNSKGFKHAVAAPRGAAKSTVISTIYPLWCIAYNKKRFIILLSDTISQSEDFLAEIKREIGNNALLLRDFPHLAGEGAIWRGDEVITKNDIKILALGTGSKIRGRRYGVNRPDLIIADDIESAKTIRSESERTHIRHEWFDKEVLHVYGEKGTYTDFLFIGTILGKSSLLYALLDSQQYPDWTGKIFKAVISFSESDLWNKWAEIYKDRFNENRIDDARKFFEENREGMLDGTKVLWPEGEPYYDLMVVRLSSPSAFQAEKQNNPLDPTKIIITLEELRFENFNVDPWLSIIKNRRNPIYGAIDPSLGKHQKKGDPSCICTVVKDLATGFILVQGISLKRRIVDKQIEDILKFHIYYNEHYGRGYKLFAVETNAFQLVLADNLRKESRKSGIYVPIKDVVVKNDKKARFEKHVPLLRDGTVIFDTIKNRNTAEYNKAIEQISTFVGDGSDLEDDAVDGLSLALDIVTTPKFKLRTKSAKQK